MSSFTTAPGVVGGAAWLRQGGAGTAAASAASQMRSVVGDDIHLTAEHAAGVDPLIPGHGQTIPRSVSRTRQHHLNVAREPSWLS